jgi:S1-C subfamily serine protease
MVHRLSRLAIAGLIAAVTSVYADDPKCNVAVRECDQQIRNMLGGRRYHGAQIEEKKPGLVIKSIAEKSPAERAGLRVGDRLIAINGKSLTHASSRDFKQLVADARKTGRVGLIIWRQGGYRKLDIRLEPYSKEQMDKIIAGHLATHAHPAGSN